MIFKTRSALACIFAVLLYDFVLAQGIYTCVDGKGRKITSDRPIAECMDRAQKEISPSGTVKRVLAPPPTAQERAALEEREKLEADGLAKAAEQKQRDRTLLKRYPDRASHDKERTAAIELVNDAISAATKRSEDLAGQRKGISAELDFYKSTPGKAPPALKRRLDETDGNMATHKRLLGEKEAEKKRMTERFDTEAAKLKPQWGVVEAPVTAGPATGAKKP